MYYLVDSVKQSLHGDDIEGGNFIVNFSSIMDCRPAMQPIDIIKCYILNHTEQAHVGVLLSVFPNPGYEKFTFILPEARNLGNNVLVAVSTIDGKVISKSNYELKKSNSFDLLRDVFPSSGVYFVSIYASPQSIYTAKLVVQ